MCTKPMTASRERRVLLGISKRKVKDLDKWARSFARALHHSSVTEGK
jgi:hypothetical protein